MFIYNFVHFEVTFKNLVLFWVLQPMFIVQIEQRKSLWIDLYLNFKGVVHFLNNFNPHVIQDVHVFLSSVEKKLRFLM